MSAAGRGPRLGGSADDYPTPAWALWRFAERFGDFIGPGHLLDPCAGSGGLMRAGCWPDRRWLGIEINARHGAKLRDAAHDYMIGDFLRNQSVEAWIKRRAHHIHAIVTNPPYSLAQEFIERCQALLPGKPIVMLLRLNFLASEGRHGLMRGFGPSVYVLPNRPSFRRNAEGRAATDATEYAWFYFPPKPRRRGFVEVLDLTPASERR